MLYKSPLWQKLPDWARVPGVERAEYASLHLQKELSPLQRDSALETAVYLVTRGGAARAEAEAEAKKGAPG